MAANQVRSPQPRVAGTPKSVGSAFLQHERRARTVCVDERRRSLSARMIDICKGASGIDERTATISLHRVTESLKIDALEELAKLFNCAMISWLE